MPTRLLLVRHGSTAMSEADRFCGRTDPPLSPRGEEQARATSLRLSRESITAVYASSMRRALRTAELLTDGRGLSITPDPALREIDHGRWETLAESEVKARFSAEYAAWSADPLTFAPEGGETGLAVLSRALPALRRIVESHADSTVLIVSHKATIRLCASVLLGLDPRRYRDRLLLDAAALSILTFDTFDHAHLSLWNWTP